MRGTGRRLLGVAVLAALGAALFAGRLYPGGAPALASRLVSAARDAGDGGWILLATLQVLVSASGVLPASLLGIAAGTVYGVGAGFAVAMVGTLIGAVLAFALARSLFRARIAAFMARRPQLRGIDVLVARDRWRFVCLLRLSPVMPFALTSYALGLSSVSLRDYLIGTLASLPALFGYVLAGALAGHGLASWGTDAGMVQWAMLALGTAATLALTLRLGWIVQRARAAAGHGGPEPLAPLMDR